MRSRDWIASAAWLVSLGLLVVALLLSAAAPAAAQPPPNDNIAQAVPLVIGTTDSRFSTVDATEEVGESLTPSGAVDRRVCSYAGGRQSQTSSTAWWSVIGTGRKLSITTAGSGFDSHLGIFDGELNDNSLRCFNGSPNEFIDVDSIAGQRYRIQVGGCVSDTDPTRPCGLPIHGPVSLL
jgi:hypothetical protein